MGLGDLLRAKVGNDDTVVTNTQKVVQPEARTPVMKTSKRVANTFANPTEQLELRRGAPLYKYYGIWDYMTDTTQHQLVRFIAGGFTTEQQTIDFLNTYEIRVLGKIIIQSYYEHHYNENIEREVNAHLGVKQII